MPRIKTYPGSFVQVLEEHIVLAASGMNTLVGERQRLKHEARSRVLKRFAWLETGDVRRVETSAARPEAAFECNTPQSAQAMRPNPQTS